MNTEPLKPIIGKLLKRKSLSLLDASEIELLKKFSGYTDEKPKDTMPKPFWHWLRKGVHGLTRDLPEFDFFFDFEDELDQILRNATGKDANWMTMAACLAEPISLPGLQRAIKRILAGDGDVIGDSRTAAIAIAGMAGLSELKSDIMAAFHSLSKENEFRAEGSAIAALIALLLLNAEEAAEIVNDLEGVSSENVRSVVFYYHGKHPEELSDEKVIELVKAESNGDYLYLAPKLVQRAIDLGIDSTATLQRVLQFFTGSFHRDDDFRYCHEFADIVVKCENSDLIRASLQGDDGPTSIAVLVELIRHRAVWALPVIQAQLSEENDSELTGCLLAAVGLLSSTPNQVFDGWMDDTEWEHNCGILWGLLTDDSLKKFAEDMASSGDGIVSKTAALVLNLQKGAEQPLIEISTGQLISESDVGWLPLVLWAVLERESMPLPDALVDVLFYLDLLESEVAVEFYRHRPYRLCALLQGKAMELRDSLYFRAIGIAGEIGGEVFRSLLEDILVSCDDDEKSVPLMLELACIGGPQTNLGRTTVKLISAGDGIELEQEELLPASLLAFTNEDPIREWAFTSLAISGAESSVFSLGLKSPDFMSTTDAVMKALPLIENIVDPLIHDAQLVLKNSGVNEADLLVLDRLLALPIEDIKAKLPQIIAKTGLPASEKMSRIFGLAADSEPAVRCSAIGTLLGEVDEHWVRELAHNMLADSDWDIRGQMASLVGQSEDISLLPKLISVFVEVAGSDIQERCMEAIQRIIAAHPSYGIGFWNVSDPEDLNKFFNADEKFEFNFDEDAQKAEGLRVLLEILRKRADVKFAKKHKDQVILIERLNEDTVLAESQQRLTMGEFEKLAAFLTVTYADEESGNIVTAVGSEPSGELLNAMFQAGPVAVFTAKWS